MSFLKARCIRVTLIAAIFLSVSNQLKAQTSLATGDIAFTGYIGNDPTLSDQFSFVILVPTTANTVIRFTDFGWRTDVSQFINRNGNLESELVLTTNAAYPAGTEITIVANPTTTATVLGGGSAGTVTYSTGAGFLVGNFSFSSNGDQVFAYQGTFASPTFIAGIHMNVYTTANGDPTNTDATNWDGVIPTPGSFETANSSGKPAALTTGTNAIWIGTAGNNASEKDNGKFNCTGPLTTAAQVRAACNNQANWITSDATAGFTLPTGCNYLGVLSAPTINTNPSNSSICNGNNASFTVVASGATGYQWQEDQGSGFNNLSNTGVYSNVTTPTLNITGAALSMNGYQYRCVASNGVGSTNSTAATLTVLAIPANPTLNIKTPATASVADGTNVSATFNAGSGGTGCNDDYVYSIDGGATLLSYTPGTNINTTGVAAGSGFVFIKGRRASCSSGCTNSYVVLASWLVTPLPAGATTLAAGDIAFTGYASNYPTAAEDNFSFVLLKNIGPGTVLNFTDNGYQSGALTNTEGTLTWTSNAAYQAGTEIKITGLAATLVSGGSAGTVTGTAVSLSTNGDQVLAYTGSAASPTFISGIHMNVYSTANGDPTTTTAAAWDGAAATTNASALPPGLTTGVNCIWIGTQTVIASEFDNSRFGNCSNPAVPGDIVALRAALNNQANWTSDNNQPPSFTLPTGCNYLGAGAAAPTINTNPSNAIVCENAAASFTIVASGATSYQWQEDQGSGFNNISNGGVFSGATTATLNISAAALSMNGYAYRCVATNGAGSTPSTGATLTVNPLPVGPTLLAKTPVSFTVADGTNVSATFNAGSGGTGCADDFRYTTDGGLTYLAYTPGNNISTTGISTGSGFVFIEGRRANCSAGCQGVYKVLAYWRVTPLPAGATTLGAGDIAFSAYASTSTPDAFSFVLLKNIGPGTVINFTDNGYQAGALTNTETTVTWTAPAGGLPGGTEITISGLTATRSGTGAAGTVTGSALSLTTTGDQVLAYQGSAGSPTFISGIHMNVYTIANGDPVNTTAAAWDGAATGNNASALPPGLTTGVNAIWIGTQGDINSEHRNAKYGNCSAPELNGSLVALRAALNNQANWIVDDNTPPAFTQPTGCNYLNATSPTITAVASFTPFLACAGTPSAEQTFTVSGDNLSANIVVTAPTNMRVSLTSGAGYATSVSLTPSAGSVAVTTIYIRTSGTAPAGPISGNVTCTTTGAPQVDLPVTGSVYAIPNPYNVTGGGAACGATGGPVGLSGSDLFVDYQLQVNGINTGSPVAGTGSAISFGNQSVVGTYTVIANQGTSCQLAMTGSVTETFGPVVNPPTITQPTLVVTTGTIVVNATAGAGQTLEYKLNGGAYQASNTFSGLTPGLYNVFARVQGTTCEKPYINNPVSIWAPGTRVSDNCLFYGTSPFQDSMWSFKFSDYSRYNKYAPSLPGFTITGINGMATDPINGDVYVIMKVSAVSGRVLGKINLQTGVCTQVGNLGNNFASLTFRSDGQLFGVTGNGASSNPESLFLIDKTNGTNTLAVALGNGADGEIICFNPDDNYIYHWSGNGTVVYEKFPALPPYTPVTNIPFTGSPNGETFGAIYTGGGEFLISNISSSFNRLTTTGTITGPFGSAPDDIRGLVRASETSSITAGGPTNICGVGGSVVLTVNNGQGSYQWYKDGALIPGETNSTYTAAATGIYNCRYADICGTIDSVAAGIVVTVATPPTTSNAGADDAVCSLSYTLAGNVPSVGTGTWTQVGGPGTSIFTNANLATSGVTVSVSGVYTFRWTIATGAPCPDSQDDVVITLSSTPTTANAGPDQTRCLTPAAAIMAGNTAVSGTGTWTQTGGPVTATITSPNSPNTTITGLTTPGTYTFRWTISNPPCPSSFDAMDITVNPLPNATITGGNAYVCQESNPVLTAGFDPNYTYQWGRTLFTTPYTNLGTAQTQTVTVSGNYLLTVTNQFGCTDTAQTVMNVADYIFNGTLAAGDATQTGRINRFATISTCAAPKACPGLFTTVGSRLYDSYTITNPRNVPVCATIGINSFCATNIFCVAYLGSFNPASLCTNYLADPGSSFTFSGFYEATIPANGTMVVVVHEVNPGTGCSGYTLSVDVPREAAGITANPGLLVCNGTPVTLTASTANTYSWTPGGQTTQAINPGTSGTYGVTLGYGNHGCTNTASVNLTIENPTVNAVGNQYFCNGANASVMFSGTGATGYNWTNTNTAIGLPASGTGDLNFTATNGTGAPISGTITVTPVSGSCTGTPVTFTITVANQPTITSVTEDAVCEPGGVVNLAASGAGTISWYDSPTGGLLVNTGPTFSPNISATTTFYVESVVTTPSVQLLAMPGQSNTFPGNVRGYWFTAPANFTITSLSVPTTASSGPQSIAVVKFTGNVPPPVFSATTNAFTTVYLTQNNPSTGKIPVNIPIQSGEVIGILGYRGTINSYAPGDYVTTIAGQSVQLERLGMQFPLTTNAPHDLWREFGATTSISRVEFEYTTGTQCISAPRVPVTGTVNPLPVATATPSSQTVCSGPITTIVLGSQVPGTIYNWTRDNTVNVTGIAASGSGDISGTLTNNTTVPQTVTFSVIPTSPDGCVGATITATVIVQAVPTITCPANITVSNDVNQCGAVVSYNPTITGIPVPTVTYVFSGATTGSGSGTGSGAFFNIGTTNVMITATNVCGTASCSFNITVNDTQSPTITCPAPVTVSCVSAVPAPDIASVTAGDNCPGVTVTFVGDVISNQTCPNRYTITRTYRATDAAGNFTDCQQIITVNDQTPPTLTCPAPVTVSCTSAVPVVDITSVTGVSDNCGGAVTVTWQGDVISNQTCANRYTITRTYRATDACGNFAECTQIIVVNDQTPPVLTCPANITVSCASAVPAVNTSAVTGVSDNCGGAVTVTWQGDVISNQTCANRYTITRTYRATDVCGNFAECTQIITVNDQTPPVITCPAPVTVSCASAVPAPNTGSVTATDNCGGVITITHIGDVISNQTCANRYTITRTYRATDVCGNFAECTQIITVNDQTPPTLTCPAPITVSCASAVPAPDISLVTGVSDNCGGVVTVTWISDQVINQTCANRFTVIRTYRATDVCGNFAECTQTITVNDQTPPVLTCPAPVTVSCTSAVPVPNIALVTGVSDNCGGAVTVTFVSDVISNQTCANRYTITRTYRATDLCGNFAECTQIITVNDQTPPVLTCPAPVTVSCAGDVPAPNVSLVTGVSDNCGGPVTVTFVSDVISNQTCANRYTITRTYRATDVCGNFAQCTQIITVNDQTGPVVTCPANITVNTPAGSCTAVVTFTPTATDNCGGGVTITTVPASGSAFPIGNTTVVVTATDVCGNISTCSFVVTVRDGQLPVITLQPVNTAVCVGLNTSFTAAAITSPNAGGPLSYQWQIWNGSTWVNITGATGTTLSLNNVTQAMDNNLYRIAVTGLCSTVFSNQALLRVNPLPSVFLEAHPFASILPPQHTSIIALVSPQGGIFNWSYNGAPLPVSGNIVTPITVDQLGAYQVVYTDPNGCVNTSAVLNITAEPSYHLWVYPNPNNGQFTIRYYNQTGEQATVKVFNPVGQEVFSQALTLGVAYTNIPVNLGSPAPGVYTVRVVGNGGRIYASKKIVVFR